MANTLGIINTANELAYLTGLFNWQMLDATYTTPDNKKTVSFNIVNNLGNFNVPLAQYVSGAVNAYNLVSSALGVTSDPNQNLFNTQMTSTGIIESINRKYVLNKIPFANYDQPVDMGTGSQKITFRIIFCGTMYLTALRNFQQYIFDNSVGSLGTLQHPFYGKINNVLPIDCRTTYDYASLNFVLCEASFLTSDLTHLSPSLIKNNATQIISTWYTGIQNTITSLIGTISTAKVIGTQIGAGVGI